MAEHFGGNHADEQDKDWCPTCESVTRYDGEVCACCGRHWGSEDGSCEGK